MQRVQGEVEQEMKINKKSFWKERWNILFDILIMVADTLVVYFFYENLILTTAFVSLISVIALIKWKSKITFLIFLVSGIIGSSLEIVIITSGAWTYNLPNFMSIPVWLIVLWGITGAALYQLAVEIKRLGVKEK